MEPPHAVEDKTWAEERVGPDRILGAYAWRSLLKNGATITFNADNPGSDHSIFYGLHAAVTRRDKQLEPTGGWYPEQAVTGEEAVRAYTGWSAYSAFMEDHTGVIAPDRWGDPRRRDPHDGGRRRGGLRGGRRVSPAEAMILGKLALTFGVLLGVPIQQLVAVRRLLRAGAREGA
jgi:hypothetical protein